MKHLPLSPSISGKFLLFFTIGTSLIGKICMVSYLLMSAPFLYPIGFIIELIVGFALKSCDTESIDEYLLSCFFKRKIIISTILFFCRDFRKCYVYSLHFNLVVKYEANIKSKEVFGFHCKSHCYVSFIICNLCSYGDFIENSLL